MKCFNSFLQWYNNHCPHHHKELCIVREGGSHPHRSKTLTSQILLQSSPTFPDTHSYMQQLLQCGQQKLMIIDIDKGIYPPHNFPRRPMQRLQVSRFSGRSPGFTLILKFCPALPLLASSLPLSWLLRKTS